MSMESLNLNTLATSLPTPYQNAETDLVNNFRAAALSITTLYRSSRHASKRAYNAGYAAACNDLLMMIQQGVSVGGDSSASGSESDGMTIGKVMDWIEARMEAIKSREEEEDEEEEKEKAGERARPTGPVPAGPMAAQKQQQQPEAKANKSTAPSKPARDQPQQTSISNVTLPRQHAAPSHSSLSPSPPPAAVRQAARLAKTRSVKGSDLQVTGADQQSQFTLSPDILNSPPMSMSIAPLSDVSAGSKRRHAVMMMLDSPSSVSSGSSAPSPVATPSAITTRRRTRSSRGNNLSHVQNQNLNLTPEDMDVEEDGRERKRVARR
ncbi:hypothetical protein PM082_004446 [Marasmius tenuissimus]|nr:hypothetical protein PM082_004446 [Marasmius tenuissimus]